MKCGDDTSHCRPCYGNGDPCTDDEDTRCSVCDCHRDCTEED